MSEVKFCPQCGTEYEAQHRFCTLDGATLVSHAPRGDLVGTVLADRYLVTAKLGDGGMGQVYLAEHVRMKRKCAVKVMRPGLVSDPDAISRFNREAENASQVFHQNVAAIYDFGETSDGLIYLAMEYVEGESLARLVEREKAVHPVRTAEIIRQASEALDVAHSLGILHRDLKPENIMLARTRDRLDLVKIVDFGIARAMTSESQRVTRTGSMVGTPEYMSPEQFSGDQLDARTDIYSLALVAFNMLTGSSAYPSGTSKDNLIIRLTQPPRRLHEVKDLPWPVELQNTFDKALASNPDDRYENVLDFSRDMTAAISAMPSSQTGEIYLSALASALAARASSTPSRPLTPISTPAQDVSTTGSGAAVGGTERDDVLTPTVAGGEKTPLHESGNSAAAPAARRKSIPIMIPAAIVLAIAGFAGWKMLGGSGGNAGTNSAIMPGDSIAQAAAANAAESLVVATAVAGATGSTVTDQDVFNRVRSGVLAIRSSAGEGVAFLADASGLLIAPSHLVAGDSAVNVMINDTTRVRARTVLTDPERGLAVLAIAKNRCSRCVPLPVATNDTATDAADSSAVLAVGLSRPGRQRLIKGTISSLSDSTIRTTAKPASTESGAPILTLGGEVIGLSTYPSQGVHREIPFRNVQYVLAAAQKAIAQPGFAPAIDSLLPVRPVSPFPADAIGAVAAVENMDVMKRYQASAGDFDLLVMTPQIMAWREARAKAALEKLRAAPRGAVPAVTRIDAIQQWKGWDGCIKDKCAVVLLNAVPDKTPFLFHKPLDVVDFTRGNVGGITLLRDGIRVEPIEEAYFPAVVNGAEYAAKKKPVYHQGLAMYRAREFAPRPTGGVSKFEVVIANADGRSRPTRITLDGALVQKIINDFAAYGLTR